MTVKFKKSIFLSDSIIALSWIRGQSRLYKPFVANRVSEIQGNTDPSDWKHILGEFNIADQVSRGVSVSDLKGEWKEGPSFLSLPEIEWPCSIPRESKEGVDAEKRKPKPVMLIQQLEAAININRYSNWRRLLRVTAYVFRFIVHTRAKCCVDDGPLSAHELLVAERHWVRDAQKSLKEIKEYKSLSPFRVNGIVYVGGRTSNKRLAYDQAYPVLLPRCHRVSYLITRQIHETGHYGVATTAAKVRRRFWIVKATTLAKTLKFQCTKFRAFEHKAENQLMAELPIERVTPYSPPFHYTAIDYFGPYHVKVGRNKSTKQYGVILTCLTTRAVHLELDVDCSTQEFIQVLRRFYAIRGRPKVIQSDNGTQFVRAERELRQMIAGWNKDQLKEYCANEQVTWRFTTPLAPRHNGCAESLVKSCKHALKKSIGDQRLTPFELYTYFQEVANLINERPIGRKLNDPDDGSFICPKTTFCWGDPQAMYLRAPSGKPKTHGDV
ncbi:uncharacterized protein LOC117110892 [Anneissia japonica]|uniref:uncharacterized protein LOC117110892 n=1 Tax=Anneissia japonica TaxID=1529436 RepID=UPI0014256859|nr:uncharacterized protein LOC117110892 [Anneissia japonica]